MKKFIGSLTVFSILFSPCGFAQDEECTPEDAEAYYTEGDDEFFNQGKFVGKENDEYLKARRRTRNKNWALAIGTTAIGITTLVLVGKNHNK